MAGKGVVRSIKNIAKGFSDVQIKVREATSNDPWGPSGTLMNEIAQLTFNEADFIEIMDMIDKRLNDKGKNWRHVFKALLLLDYCLHVGSENVVLYARENIYVVKTLKEFQHLEENGKDVGANVRQKAKDITNLLQDDNRLKEERRQRQGMRDRMANVGDYLNESVRRINGEGGEDNPRWDDESELKKALAESKRIAAEEEKNRRQGDDDLEKALQMSQQEALEKERKKQETLEKENAQNLFGSSSAFPQQQNFNSMNNPYQQQQQQPPLQLEWAQPSFNSNSFSESFQPQQQSNPYQQQQPAVNPYLQATNQFNASGLQAQMTGFPQQGNPMDFFSQQQPQQQSQQQGLQAQMTGFPQQQQQQPAFQTSMVTGTNPFSQMSQSYSPMQPQQPQQPQTQQHDYSSLVFGNGAPSPQQASSPLFPPAKASTTPKFSFNTVSSPSLAFASTSTTPFSGTASPRLTAAAAAPSPNQHDTKYSKLNALLANKDDGMDTFGNQGNLRIPYGTGFASSSQFKPIEPQQQQQQPDFGAANKNPFGQMVTNSPQPQKSLLDLMQEQKQQQQQFNSSLF